VQQQFTGWRGAGKTTGLFLKEGGGSQRQIVGGAAAGENHLVVARGQQRRQGRLCLSVNGERVAPGRRLRPDFGACVDAACHGSSPQLFLYGCVTASSQVR
jgi:hypothetical protein